MVSGFCHFTKSWVSRSFDFDVDELKKECGIKKKIDQINRQRSLSSSHSTKSREIGSIGLARSLCLLNFPFFARKARTRALVCSRIIFFFSGLDLALSRYFLSEIFFASGCLTECLALYSLARTGSTGFLARGAITLRKINKTENLVLLKVH